MKLEKNSLGNTSEGLEVDQFTLANDAGLTVRLMTYGATITAVEVPDRDGNVDNVTLYLDTLSDYLAGHPFLGCVAGRYANRIAKGRFTLDDRQYNLAVNNGPNHLHGGIKGFDKAVWSAEEIREEGVVGVELSHTSPDGDEGYPGRLSVSVAYTISADNKLSMKYRAETDRATHLNLTNHAYWNLGGADSTDILGHELTLFADRYLPVDEGLIPTGKLEPVDGTPMDFTTPHAIGQRIDQVDGGYDHCYILNQNPDDRVALAASVVDAKSGRQMQVFTSQPAIQLYTANFLTAQHSRRGKPYQKHNAFCLETQHYPDTPNQPDFPTTVLRPGEKFEEVTIHEFGVLG
jgi:aldose 1-epimerase